MQQIFLVEILRIVNDGLASALIVSRHNRGVWTIERAIVGILLGGQCTSSAVRGYHPVPQ